MDRAYGSPTFHSLNPLTLHMVTASTTPDELLRQALNNIYPVDVDTLNDYIARWQPVEFRRKTIINGAGSSEKYLYYVLEGIQKSSFDSAGKEYIVAFSYPGTFSGDPVSLFLGAPSNVTLACISDSRFLRLGYSTHQQYLARHRQLESLFRRATELLLAGVLERYGELMALTIEERFKAFTSRSAHLLNVIPHKDLASYLRIDPTNFSKLINAVKI